jgi:hypothetical protein
LYGGFRTFDPNRDGECYESCYMTRALATSTGSRKAFRSSLARELQHEKCNSGLQFLALAMVMLLGGCSDEPQWKDLTGKDRSGDAMRADQIGCMSQVDGWQAKTGITLSANAIVRRRVACMTAKGWEQAS